MLQQWNRFVKWNFTILIVQQINVRAKSYFRIIYYDGLSSKCIDYLNMFFNFRSQAMKRLVMWMRRSTWWMLHVWRTWCNSQGSWLFKVHISTLCLHVNMFTIALFKNRQNYLEFTRKYIFYKEINNLQTYHYYFK